MRRRGEYLYNFWRDAGNPRGLWGLLQDFKAFALKGNVVDLAVAVVIGGAFGKIVSALVADIIMPLVNAVQRGGEWRNWTVTSLNFKVGDFLGAVVDFFLIALVLFLIVTRIRTPRVQAGSAAGDRRPARSAWSRSRRSRIAAAPAPPSSPSVAASLFSSRRRESASPT